MGVREVAPFDPAAEMALLKEWTDSVSFDNEDELDDIPDMAPELDDEGDEVDSAMTLAEWAVELSHKALPKKQKCKHCTDPATKRIIHHDGRAYTPACDRHAGKAKHGATDYVRTIGIKARTPGGREGDPSSHNFSPRQNWVDKRGGLPKYVRMVRNALVRDGHSESRATALAVSAMKRWAAGQGDVKPAVRAAAAKAVAQWEAMKSNK